MYIQCINGDNEILLQLVQLQAMTCTIMCVLLYVLLPLWVCTSCKPILICVILNLQLQI